MLLAQDSYDIDLSLLKHRYVDAASDLSSWPMRLLIVAVVLLTVAAVLSMIYHCLNKESEKRETKLEPKNSSLRPPQEKRRKK